MFFFLITCCFSLLFFYNSLSIINPLPAWACDMRLLSLWFWKDSSFSQITKSIRGFRIPCKKNKVETTVETTLSHMSVLDLPDLVLESILEKLPPEGLFRMASVCTSLRDRCLSDHLWEKHMNAKWGKLVGPAAYREWRSRKGLIFLDRSKRKGLLAYLTHFIRKRNNFLLLDSTMSWYFALESGRFWFPAQVYNRENGHVGFMLSCYDAELRYDQRTNTFEARYPPHGRRASPTESEVPWDRLRAPPVDTSPHDLHVSDCLNDLQPGDHIEIQWRRNKGFPYGWWYGVVGHLETCDGNANYCRCHDNDTVILEFNQYSQGSRWRTTTVNRKHHREEGNEADGFYGGIRKLYTNEEISMWKKIWPPQVLE